MEPATPVASTAEAPRRRGLVAGVFVALVVLFVLVRLPAMNTQLWWGSAEQHHYGLFPHHLVHGLAGPALDYLPEVHQGCAVIWGAACAPLFAANGSTRGSLRWCNLLWHSAMFALFALLAVRLAGLPGLVGTGLLWLLAPPSVIDASHFGWVTHIDAGLLTALCLLFLCGAERGGRRAWWGFAAGVVAGLSVWFYFDSVLVLAGLALAAMSLLDRRSAGWAGAGFGLTLLPQIVIGGWWSHPGGLDAALSGDGPGLVARLGGLLGDALPRMWGYPGADGPDATWLGGPELPGTLYWLGLGLALAAGVVLARGAAGLVARAALFGVVVHLLGCLLSGFDLSHGRYLMPMWPWLVLGAGAGAGRAVVEGGRAARALAAVGCVLLVGLGLKFGPATWAPVDPPMRAWADARAAYVLPEHAFAQVLLDGGPDALLDLLERYPGDRGDLLLLAGRSLARRGRGAVPAVGDRVPAVAQPYFLEGLGRELAEQRAKEGPIDVAWAEQTWRAMPAGRPDFSRGALFGSFVRLLDDVRDDWLRIEQAGLSPRERDQLCISYGAWSQPLGWTYQPLRRTDTWCSPDAFAVGVGAGLARTMVPPGRMPDGQPELSWWLGEEPTGPVRGAFLCGWSTEKRRLRALAGDGWREARPLPSPHERCLSGRAD